MCGIVGYIGARPAQPVLLQALKRLEYRGYDSCGIALAGSGLGVFKEAQKVSELAAGLSPCPCTIGIGHTRWATHGKPSKINAHPHLDCQGRIAVVHNGVITNFYRIKEQLIQEGHVFRSETDSEVIPHLVEKYYQGDLEQAVARAVAELEGSYALIVLMADREELVVARNESPVVLGLGQGENLIASDVPAVLDYTDRVIYLEDGDLGTVTGEEVRIYHGGKLVCREQQRVPWSIEDAEKGGYEHFMLKEIHEQPRAILDTLRGHMSMAEAEINLGLSLGGVEDFLLLACGTSYHAALIGKYLIEELCRMPARAELASEFNYGHRTLGKTCVIGITQSGETADTLKALKRARSLGGRTLAITNVVGSSASRLADRCFYTRAGPEIGVAATKSFVTQLVSLYLLAFSFPGLEAKTRQGLMEELRRLPGKVQRILNQKKTIAAHGAYLAQFDHVFFVARGINYPVALEGALKLKEISYIHAEGYAAGELKHGPFALLTPQVPVVTIVAQDDTRQTLLANMREIKARESPLIALAEEGDKEIEQFADFVIPLPRMNPLLSPIVNTVVLQLLAYFAARERGCPIDQPRNLAKSVTVE